MKYFIVPVLLFTTTLSFSQSKKDLIAEVDRLKAQIVELKKPKEVTISNAHQRASYAVGIVMAKNLKTQGGDSLDVELISQAFKDFYANKDLKIAEPECMPVVQEYMQAAAEKKNGQLRAENAAFLEANKTKAGVQVTSSGLQYKVLSSANAAGKMPAATSNVTVHYTGKLIDGTIFDSSVQRGQPASFGLNQVISGWTEGLQLMREGDKFEFYIPYVLGYGERGAGGQIPPFATLIFEVELIKVN